MIDQPQETDAKVRNAIEKIWCELLTVDGVGDAAHFGALGGDSIAATVCLIRIQETLGIEMPVSALLSDESSFGRLVSEVRIALARAARASDLGNAG